MVTQSKLDAYGHMNWTVCEVEGPINYSEWVACFDAVYVPETNTIEYEVVVDNGNSVGTVKRGSLLACDSESVFCLKGLPQFWYNVGMEQGVAMDRESLALTTESWASHIDGLISNAIAEEEMDATIEQSGDYLDRFVL